MGKWPQVPKVAAGFQPAVHAARLGRAARGCPYPVAGRSSLRKPNRVSDGEVAAGFQPAVHSARLGRAARGCPCPVAGRSLRASCPPLARCFLRFAILARGGNKRRLPGHGQPRAPCSQWPRFSTWVPCHGQDGDAARSVSVTMYTRVYNARMASLPHPEMARRPPWACRRPWPSRSPACLLTPCEPCRRCCLP